MVPNSKHLKSPSSIAPIKYTNRRPPGPIVQFWPDLQLHRCDLLFIHIGPKLPKSIVVAIPINRQHPKSIVAAIPIDRQDPKPTVAAIPIYSQHLKSIVAAIPINRQRSSQL